MYFLHKRHLIGLLLLIYSLSYFLQSWFFIDFGSVFAENPLDRTHLVAVFVDKDIYQDTKSDIERYATDYIQQRISNSKAIVLPINVENFKAIDLVRMLENMYFDGIKGKTSDLLGAVFIGDIPLPVVQNNGFIYPTIFPYVDFEEQQFIYDTNQQFFVYNDNPRGQAEIWHGILNFGSTVSQYHDFFQKLRTYATAPADFVAPLMWYDDFVGMKTTFSKDTLPFYINNFLFAEDIGYHRFTNLMVDYFKQIQNDSMGALIGGLEKVSKNNPQLEAIMQKGADSFDDLGESSVPTSMLLSVIKELITRYENLYPGVFLSAIKDNTQSAARWYKKTGSGEWVDGVDSHIHKIALKDSIVIGDASKGISPVIISFNDAMEEALDKKIEQNRWYMTLPVFVESTHKDRTNQKQRIPPRIGPAKRWCQITTNDVYKNYYFGTYAQDIISAQEFSAYRGTFRNLDSFSGVSVVDTGYVSSNLKTLGASNNLFATQVEANRGYNIMSAAIDYDTYSGNKVKEKRVISCSKRFRILWTDLFCMSTKGKYVGDVYESIEDFALRGWGGASSLNLNSGALSDNPPKYILNQYDYLAAMFPIYDIGGSVAITTGVSLANSFLGERSFSSIIKVKNRYGKLDYPKYMKWDVPNEKLPVDLANIYPTKSGSYLVLSGTSRIRSEYNNFDYFSIWNKTSDRGSKTWKIIDVNGMTKEWKSSDSMGGKCGGKREIYSYTYKTIDSRIKNISPTPEQINGIRENEFSEGGLFWKHYDYFKNELLFLQDSSQLSFAESLSGLQFLLSGNKQVNANISSFVALSSTDPVVLLSGVQQIFSQTGQQEYMTVSSGVFSALDQSSDTLAELNFGSILAYFDTIEEVEALYGQKTKFLSGWSNQLVSTLSAIKTQYNSLPTSFAQITSLYGGLQTQKFATGSLSSKRISINNLQNCGTSLAPKYCGCDNTYKQVCQTLDTLISSLNTLHQQVSYLGYTTVIEEVEGTPTLIEIQLLSGFQASFEDATTSGGFLSDIPLIQSGIRAIETVAVVPPLTFVPGLNQTTADRPIDGPRRISFQGLGGKLVTFVYPNIYDVSVYNQQESILVLKTIEEINQSLLDYLVKKAKEYNALLLAQEQGRQQYYNSNRQAFDFLATSDSLASPNARSTAYLSEDFFVSLIGKQRIYDIAEALYYQTLPVYSKQNEQYVDKDLATMRSSFDLNKKIAYVVSGYLTQHPNQGSLITPAYNASGYEVAYINSDRSDFLSASETPSFIQQLQRSQKPLANTFIEDSSLNANELFDATKRQCGIDSSYTELIFDLNEDQGKGKMPWVSAINCWWSTLGSSIKFDVSMEVGPSFGEFLSGLQSSFDTWIDSFKKLATNNKQPGADFSGNISEYWANTINITGDDPSLVPKIKDISLKFPTKKLLAGSQLPITISAQDFSGKNISRVMDSYYSYVTTGNGTFIGGGFSGPQSMEFFDFDTTMLLYQAPMVQQPTTITFSLTGKDAEYKESIVVTPGVFEVAYGSKKLYTNDKVQGTLSFSLTGVDSTYSTLPRIVVSLRAKDGSLLQTPFSILSKNGLFTPGVVSSGNFVGLTTYFLEKTEQAVFLMPKYRAGNDELWIQIPGLDPIVIPVVVGPGSPYHVDLKTSTSIVSVGESLSGMISVTDAWGNILSTSIPVKIGSLGALDVSSTTVQVDQHGYSFSTKSQEPGGISYLYAFLNEIPLANQSPAYQKIIVQEQFLPQKNLNVMYLNLFGSDRGNLWTQDALDPSYIPNLVSSSQKLLAVTTQITEPTRLKKFAAIVSECGQVRNFTDRKIVLRPFSGSLVAELLDVGYFSLAKNQNLKLYSSEDPIKTLQGFSAKDPALVFIKDDSLSLENFEISDTSLSFSGVVLFDIQQEIWDLELSIELSSSLDQGYSVWNLLYQGKQLGKLYYIQAKESSLDLSRVHMYSPFAYDKGITFAEGTTNGEQGIGIIDLLGNFEKEGYTSIEDSSSYEKGAGFRSDFKNVTLFGDGKSVGESTIPFGSHFLINFGDPLLSRISENPEISSVNHDLGIGDYVYNNPSKSIFKVLDTDINNDGLTDILIVFTDGTIKLLKNYGGTHPYSNMQDLMRLSDSIKDIYVGDVDGNNYPDILVWTMNHQLRVYKNDKGIFDVDGNLICLNINADGTKIQKNPQSVQGLQQLFFEDMDKDGNIDIVTNDLIGDIKIFYGGSKNGQGHYVSTLEYTCDDDWYSRQKESIRLVKSYGVVVEPDFYIQDSSLIHVKGWNISSQLPVSSDQVKDLVPDEDSFDPTKGDLDLGAFVGDMSNSFQNLANDSLANILSVAPISYIPVYESTGKLDDIGYKSLSQLSGDSSISIYKQYTDKNGGVLLSGDVVSITTTILGLKNNIKATYIDRLVGPWEILTNDENQITSFKKESGNFDYEDIVWLDADESLFVLDDIDLDIRQSLSFSYDVMYLGEPTVSIDVKDILFSDKNKKQDGYSDIVVYPLDSCKKYRRIFFNTSSKSHRSYEEIFDNIQAKLDAYTAQGQAEGDALLESSVPAVSSGTFSSDSTATDYQDGVNSVLGQLNMEGLFESWTVPDLFSNSVNLEFDMSALDAMMAPISEEIDKILDGLCQGFKLGAKAGCQPPVPFNKIPFNQAFLGAGDYHLFGCFQNLMEPLSSTLGKGLPLISFPGNRGPTPVGYLPLPDIFGFPFRSPVGDDFFIGGSQNGTYPSQLRLYLVPTLTLQMGVAICFGPSTLGAAIPALFRDLGGNCVVVAFPLYACNGGGSGSGEDPATEELESWMTDLAANGSCEQPAQQGSAKVLSNTIIVQQPTYPSAFRLSSLGSESSSWTMAVPNGNFGGFGYVSFNSKPTKKSTTVSSYGGMGLGFNFDAFSFIQGAKIDLKIKDSNAQGIIKALVKDWLGRQVKYMVNNLTKLTINITLPDVSQLADGFDTLFSSVSWSESAEQAEKDDVTTFGDLEYILSKQTYQAATSSANNPFESLITIFESVPLVDLYTKDVVLKIPLPTSDELLKYDSYLRGWLKNQQKVLKQRLEAIHELASVCGGISPEQADKELRQLDKEKKDLDKIENIDFSEKTKLKESIQKEEQFWIKVRNGDIVSPETPLVEDTKAVFVDIGKQFELFGQKVSALPKLKFIENCLTTTSYSQKCSPWADLNPKEKEVKLSEVKEEITSLSSCAMFSSNMDSFTTFYNQALDLVRNVQQNIQILEQYKQFPLQLYDWMHFIDKYMADIMNFVSALSSTLIGWVNINAKIYTKWVNALILILSAIKTWQVLIDLSTNWTKKCGKCSRDGYGSHGCSLGFLFPKIPILPIPAFKIPNINIDLSHIDLGISIALPRFVFTPVDFPLPQLPNLPPPPNFNLAVGLDFAIKFDYTLPEVPLLPAPPTLPELPSFIPRLDFSLPLLPPAPKIPNIIPEISSIIEIADFVVQIFCILKKGFGLVGEEGVKAKVEQMTQRTWDVPIFDFFDQTFTWQTDPKPQGFDLQLDGFLQFKMDFSGFYGFLNQIAESVNQVAYNVTSSYSKAIDQVSSGLNNNKAMDFLNNDIQDVDINFAPSLTIPLDPLLGDASLLEYDVAYNQLTAGLQEFSSRVDDPDIKKDISKISSVLQTSNVVSPATKELQSIQKEIQTILIDKQKEIRQLADAVSSYDRFVAQIKRNDIALVNDDHIKISFASPLFTTDKETYNLLQQQESPLKAYMDTNASLVNGYLETLSISSPDELRMTKSDYDKSTQYLQEMKGTIDVVYDTLGFDKLAYSSCGLPYVVEDEIDSPSLLLSQTTTSSSTSSSPTAFASDISSYVRGVFVENVNSGTMINVVRSQPYVTKIRDRYFATDINQDTKKDLVMWDNNSIYIKYAQQDSQHKNLTTTKSFYVYDPGFLAASFADSYQQLSEKADSDGYVDFGDISVKVISPVQEVKNFKMVGQSFDAIQLSWTNQTTLGEPVDGYLIKLNHRIDTYHDKDDNFRFLDDEFLNKRYILVLPNETNYSGATIDFKERYYYKGKDASKARSVLDFLTGGIYSELILAVKSYQPTQKTISIGLNEIPRNWQYAEIISLKNTDTNENPYYISQGPWSNQIVAGRQLVADSVGPEAIITLQRPSISETVSTGSRHKGFVGTYYTLAADWKDNVAVSRMWIQQGDQVLQVSTGVAQTGFIQLPGLYFTGETSLEYLFGAEDFNGNTQLEKVTLDVEIPKISLKDFVPLSEFSGQLIAELSQDIDEGMVMFQRQRNDFWQEMSGTLSNTYGGFFVGPRQTIVTGSIFSMGNTLGLYDDRGNEIGQITIDGQITLLPRYQDIYAVNLDLVTGYPLVRVVNRETGTTVFWIQMPAYALNDISLYQKEPFYSKIDLTQPNFGAFFGGNCIQSLDKECILYVSSIGQLYIPKSFSTSLVGEYRYDSTTRSVIYVIKDFLEKDIVRITTKTRLMK